MILSPATNVFGQPDDYAGMVAYEPGQCNIGPAERSKRRTIGYLGFIAGVVVVVAVPALRLDPLWMLASAAPFYAGFIGILQARSSFCAGFGLAGVYDVSESGEARLDVDDPDARTADKKKALILQLEAVGLSVVLSGAIYGVAAVVA